MRKQLEVLEHHANARTQFRQVGLWIANRDAVDGDITLLEWLQAVDRLDQRRFAGPRRAAHHHHVTLGDLRGAIGQDLKLTVPFADVIKLNHEYFS